MITTDWPQSWQQNSKLYEQSEGHSFFFGGGGTVEWGAETINGRNWKQIMLVFNEYIFTKKYIIR